MNPTIFIDVDDTLKRSFGSKSFPITHMVEVVKSLFDKGMTLYCWSSGGAEYAKASAIELGIEHCFKEFLPKPVVVIDDIPMAEWFLTELHPNECRGLDLEEMIKRVK